MRLTYHWELSKLWNWNDFHAFPFSVFTSFLSFHALYFFFEKVLILKGHRPCFIT
jgi:hypothetical protein